MVYAIDTAPTPTINLEIRRNEIHSAHDKAIKQLIEVGRLLVDTQTHLAEKSFIQFCDTLKFSRQTAYNYMRLYSHSLVQRLDSLENALINLSVWYIVPPENTETVQRIQALAADGKKVTKELASQLVNESAPLNEALHKAALQAPQETVNMLMTGTAMDTDGNHVPLIDSDNTLIQINATDDEYERLQRQQLYIQDKAKKKVKLECQLELIQVNGRWRFALPEDVSGKLKDTTFSIWYSVKEETETSTEADAA